jgi:hypothetical protein
MLGEDITRTDKGREHNPGLLTFPVLVDFFDQDGLSGKLQLHPPGSWDRRGARSQEQRLDQRLRAVDTGNGLGNSRRIESMDNPLINEQAA